VARPGKENPWGEPPPSPLMRFIQIWWLPKPVPPPEGTPERAAFDEQQKLARELAWRAGGAIGGGGG
jgi:hypothetical protein